MASRPASSAPPATIWLVSATRNGKRLIAVVLGSSSGRQRAVRAAQLLERGFANTGLSWLRPSLGSVDNLVPVNASPPNLRDEICGGKRKRPATDEDAETTAAGNAGGGENNPIAFFTAGLQAPMPKASDLLAAGREASEPMVVYTGPKKTGTALIAAVAVDEQKQTTRPRGKKSRVAAKPDAAAEPKAEAKPAKQASQIRTKQPQAGRPARQRQAGRRAENREAGGRAESREAAAPKLPTSPPRGQAGQTQGCCQARARRHRG